MGKKEFNVEDLPDLCDPSEQVTTTLIGVEQNFEKNKQTGEEKKGFWQGLFSKKEK